MEWFSQFDMIFIYDPHRQSSSTNNRRSAFADPGQFRRKRRRRRGAHVALSQGFDCRNHQKPKKRRTQKSCLTTPDFLKLFFFECSMLGDPNMSFFHLPIWKWGWSSAKLGLATTFGSSFARTEQCLEDTPSSCGIHNVILAATR